MRTELADGRHYTLALPPGTVLDGTYRIIRVLNQSSTYAVTYLAHDQRAADQVVLKEFLPRTLAARASDELTLLPHTADDASTLSRALRRFLREAELLADIAHPHIPRARRSFEANGTAYLVLQNYEGRTLAHHVAEAGNRLPADYAAAIVLQVLHGLGALHAEGVIHGYITPDNILVDANSRALILGLGTTRHVVGPGREPVAGFAPIEQYAAREVGPWTDVYACAAVLYRLTTGVTPPSAVERSAGQNVTIPAGAAANLSPALSRTIVAALAQLPDARPHSAEEFRRRLDSSLALGTDAMAPRVEHRPSNAQRAMESAPRWAAPETPARWVAPESNPRAAAPESNPHWVAPESNPRAAAPESNPHWVAPKPKGPAIDAPALAEREPDSPRYEDDVVFLTDVGGPRDRIRRLIRMVLGIGGAAAGVLLLVSALGGRPEAQWSGSDAVAAQVAPTALVSPVATSAPPAERDSLPRPVSDALVRPSVVPERSLREAGIDLPSSAPSTQEDAPPRSSQPTRRPVSVPPPPAVPPERVTARSQSAPRPVRQAGSSSTANRAPVTLASGPPSVTVSFAPALGRVELLPSEVLTGLRERLAHGNENNGFGEYATARRIYRGALDQIAKLGDRYPGAQALVSLKRELELAADRALSACTAENEVIRRRNGKAAECD